MLQGEADTYAANQEAMSDLGVGRMAAEATMQQALQDAAAKMGTAHYLPWSNVAAAQAQAKSASDAAAAQALAEYRAEQMKDARAREGLSALMQFAAPLMNQSYGGGGMQTNYGAGFTG